MDIVGQKNMQMNKKSTLAAIVGFNRPDHLKKCIQSVKISLNNFNKNIKVIIFLDRDLSNSPGWIQCENLVKNSGFEFYINTENIGLRLNMYQIFNYFKESSFDRLILIEDDIDVSPNFFYFFHINFDLFELYPNVFQISGFSPIQSLKNEHDFFLYPRISTWGWGTWKSKFPFPSEVKLDWNNFFMTKKILNTLKIYAPDVVNLYKLQKNGQIKTWSLDYYNYMLQNDLFSVYPLISCVKNFGFDGSGINNSNMKPILNLSISKTELEVLPRDLNNELDKEIFKKYFLKYYSPPFLFKLIYKLFGIKL